MKNGKEPFYTKSWFMWVMLIFIAPVGIFLMWKYRNFNKILKVVLSVFFGFVFLVAIIPSSNDSKSTPTDIAEVAPTPTETSSEKPSPTPSSTETAISSLPTINKDEYIAKTGLETYKALQEEGYTVSAKFENDFVAKINGDASELFEKTSLDDLESIDAFLVSDIVQNGDNIELIIGEPAITLTPEPTPNTNITMGQKNALNSAKQYLSFTAFSYTGLIKQLEYEKYSNEDAVYAADNCGADWNEQAAKSAKSYLEITPFSREGLITQLEYAGFTKEQAVYGVEANGY